MNLMMPNFKNGNLKKNHNFSAVIISNEIDDRNESIQITITLNK